MPKQKQRAQLNLNAIPNRDLLQRLNFLYQTSVYLQSLASSNTDEAKSTIKALSRVHGGTVMRISKKAQIKLAPSMKRSICRSCGVVLQVGVTASVRVKACKTHASRVSTTCVACSTNSSLPRSPQSICNAIVESPPINDANNGTNETKAINLTNQSSNQAQRRFMKHRSRRRHQHTPFLDRDGHIVICGNNPVRRSRTDGEFASTISPL